MRAHDNGSAGRGGAAWLSRRRLDERGVALPMAVIFVGLLTMLMLAFGVLGQSEGLIASNHMRMTQARANAESGFQHALGALTTCAKDDSTPAQCLAAPPVPFDGSAFVDPGITGGYFVLVSVIDDNGRRIRARGCVPNCDTPRAQRIVQADMMWLPPLDVDSLGAINVKGNLTVKGTTMIDGRGCGKFGAMTAGEINPDGADWGNAKIYGASGGDPNTPNEAGIDYLTNAPAENFDAITLNDTALDFFREMAKQNGTYFGPGHPNGTPATDPPWSGEIYFNSSNKLKDGIVFIDTVSGDNIPTSMDAQNPDDFASVTIHGNPFIGKNNDGVFHGVLIVNGSLQITGSMQMQALVYTVNDFVYNGTGEGRIDGVVISQNIREQDSTISEVESTTGGNSRIIPDDFCDANLVPWGFKVTAGSYREVEGDTL